MTWRMGDIGKKKGHFYFSIIFVVMVPNQLGKGTSLYIYLLLVVNVSTH